MFVVLTPFTFLFLVFYFMFLLFLLFSCDFYLYWVVIECSSLMFIGVCYSFMSFGFSNIILYFVIQALSSVNIFVFYSVSIDSMLLFSLFLKLAVFPFFSWFVMVASKVNLTVFLLISTFQKIPSLLLFHSFVFTYSYSFFIYCLLSTVFCSSLFIFNTPSFRVFLSFSSVGGNSWLLLSSFCGLDFLFLFFGFYCLNMLLLFYYSSPSLKLSYFSPDSLFLLFFFGLISLGGFPPFPIFFLKLYIFYFLSSLSFFGVWSFVLLLIFSVYSLSSYFRFVSFYLVSKFSFSGCTFL